jgi:hypothetical protein
MGRSHLQLRLSILGSTSQPVDPTIAHRKVYGRHASNLEYPRHRAYRREKLCRNPSIEIPTGHGRSRRQPL